MTHPYFSHIMTDEALDLYEDLVGESIHVNGIDCFYIPRDIDSVDEVLNEIYHANYKRVYRIEVFREEVGGFYPNDFFVSKFGSEWGGQNSVFAVSKKHFTQVTGSAYPDQGGLLVFPSVKQVYQVKDIDTRDPWISNGRMFYWKMSCAPFDKNKKDTFNKEIYEYIDEVTEEFLSDFDDSVELADLEFMTADNDCIYASTTKHLASEDMGYDYFVPWTADREDIDASDDTAFASSDSAINRGEGPMQSITVKHPDYKNEQIQRDAAQFTDFGFN